MVGVHREALGRRPILHHHGIRRRQAPHRTRAALPGGRLGLHRAAIENGADAVYFGLDTGFNARARATNFTVDDLPRLMATLHRHGVRGYATLNTLVFSDELSAFGRTVEAIADAGVDAVLVQDIGAATLIRQRRPELPLHASTQMTLTSAETIDLAERLGMQRVVVARELSIEEIAAIRRRTSMPLEVFVHGALCVAYSGQCLTSESLGGRSANRGQCAQACRLPYELVCDGRDVDLGDQAYLLSPQDLAAYALAPELLDAGVSAFKIEGRLKTPEYVAAITAHYRRAIDMAVAGRQVVFAPARSRRWSSPSPAASRRGGSTAATTRCSCPPHRARSGACGSAPWWRSGANGSRWTSWGA